MPTDPIVLQTNTGMSGDLFKVMGNNVYEYLISYMFIIVSRELLYPENEEAPNFIYISQQHIIKARGLQQGINLLEGQK